MSEQLWIKSIKIYFRIKCLVLAKWKFLVNCWWFGIYRKSSLGVDLLAHFNYLIELFSQVFNFEGASHSLLLGWITIFTISWAHKPINSMNLKKKHLSINLDTISSFWIIFILLGHSTFYLAFYTISISFIFWKILEILLSLTQIFHSFDILGLSFTSIAISTEQNC